MFRLRKLFALVWEVLTFAITSMTLCSKFTNLSCSFNWLSVLLIICKCGRVHLITLDVLTPCLTKASLAHVTCFMFSLLMHLLLLAWIDKVRSFQFSDWIVAKPVLVGASITLGTETLGFQMWTLLNLVWNFNLLFLGWDEVVVGTLITSLAISLTKLLTDNGVFKPALGTIVAVAFKEEITN